MNYLLDGPSFRPPLHRLTSAQKPTIIVDRSFDTKNFCWLIGIWAAFAAGTVTACVLGVPEDSIGHAAFSHMEKDPHR